MIGSAEMMARLGLAALAGSLIGLERERLGWAAGLRTHMLVAVGSCLIIIVSAYGFTPVLGPHVVLDPSRIAAQVVSGIGFLGAGTILLRGEAVKGLTTAASLWAVAAIGLAIGSGLYAAGLATVAIVLVILAGLKPLGERLQQQSWSRTRACLVLVTARPGTLTMPVLQKALGHRAALLRQFVLSRGAAGEPDAVEITFARLSRAAATEVVAAIAALPDVVSAKLA